MTLKAKRAVFVCGAAIAAMTLSVTAHAEQSIFDVPAQEARKSIPEFARQADIQISAPTGQLQGVKTNAVKGRLDARAALGILLQGTGLHIADDNGSMIVLKRADRGARNPSQNPSMEQPDPGRPPARPMEMSAPVEDEEMAPTIIVTAQRREQRAVDVGISLNVFGKQELASRRMNSVKDLSLLTPGLDVFDGNGTNNPTITLRGVGTTNPFLNNNPSVAVYADGVYLPFSSFLTLPFFDLERVEVLKGPQVTLYGRNATAGAINIISSPPTRDPSGYFDVSYGSYDLLEARAAISGPLSDRLQLRLAGIWQDGGGYMRRAGTIGSTAGFTRSPRVPGVAAVPAIDGYGDKDVYALRASLAWQPSDTVDISVAAHFGDDQSELVGSTNLNGDRLRVFSPPSAEAFVDYDNVYPKTDTEQFGVVIQANVDLGPIKVTSLTGYNKIDRVYAIGDFVPVRIAEANFDEVIKSFSQELRAAYVDTDIHLTFGASYNNDKIDYERVLVAHDFLLGSLGTAFKETNRAMAVYGDGEWEFRPNWFLGGGLRYTVEDKNYVGGSFVLNPFGVSRVHLAFPQVGLTGLFGSPTYDESDLSGKLSLNWKPRDEWLVYASVNRGFKSGGFDGSGITTRSAFDPYSSEKVWAYEAGVKTSLVGLDLSASAFFYDYSNKQVLALVDIGGGITEAIIQNAAAAEIKGFEAELRWRPVRGLAFSLNGTLLDSEITDFVSANPAEVAARIGNELPGSPKSQVTGAIDYAVELPADLMFEVSLWASHVNDAFRDIENTETLKSDQRFLVSGRMTLSNPGVGWSLYGYVDNLFDKTYVTSVRSLLGMLGNYYGPPRTAGVGLKYQF